MDYEGYTVPLALFDYIPVGLSVIAFYLLSRRIAILTPEVKTFAVVAWLVTGSAGVFKASWKLLLTGADMNVRWMNDQLFFLLFTGLTMMAIAVIWSKRASVDSAVMKKRWLLVLTVLAAVIIAALYLKFSNPDSRGWNFMLLGLSTVANVVLSITLIRQARQEHLNLAAVLVGLNLILVFVLSGLGRIEAQTAGVQWVAECVNTVAQGALLYGIWILYQNTKNTLVNKHAGEA